MAGHNHITNFSGDATPAQLKKRAKHEAEVRNAGGKKVSVTLFDLQDPTGFDVGTTHQVFIAQCGVNEVLEVTSLTYHAATPATCETSLVLNPPAKGGAKKGKLGASGHKDAAKDVTTEPAASPAAPATLPTNVAPATLPTNAASGGGPI